ncbi:cold shock domain-containing protein [Mycolicibacterium sp. GCM10028919]|uniref:cold shock domain-containing protein n=1 Tax=Mycolicibacterium sp. GCM10028919 TaxID=3273401 RepID=UPI003605C872
MTSTGTVRFWLREEGWGAIDSPATPGGCFVHYSDINGQRGYRELVQGDTVDFEWAKTAHPGSQDGFSFRALNVNRRVSST